jgi:hypothetical protein
MKGKRCNEKKNPILLMFHKEVRRSNQNQGVAVWKQGKHLPKTQTMAMAKTL